MRIPAMTRPCVAVGAVGCALLLAACSGPDIARLRAALVDQQDLPAELAGCMAPQLAAGLDSDSVHELMAGRVDELPAEDAKLWADAMTACSDLLGYVATRGQPTGGLHG